MMKHVVAPDTERGRLRVTRFEAFGFKSSFLIVLGWLVTGCATTYIPVPEVEGYVSYTGKGISVAKEGVTLSLLPARNPPGLPSSYSTFELIAENTGDEELDMMIGEVHLLDARGRQYNAVPPERLPYVAGPYYSSFHYHGGPGWRHHGGVVVVPVPRVIPNHPRREGLGMTKVKVLPSAMISGYVHFRCRIRGPESIRILVNRLARDDNRQITRTTRDDGTSRTEIPVRDVNYTFDFRVD